MLKELFEKRAEQIMRELRKPEYQLTPAVIERMKNMLRLCQVDVVDAGSKLTERRAVAVVETVDGKFYRHMLVKEFPQTVEYLPVFMRGELAFLRPHVVLVEDEKCVPVLWNSIIFREICHVCAIGFYDINNNRLYHNSGLNYCELEFDVEQQCINKIRWSNCNDISEKVNDWVASWLFQKIMPSDCPGYYFLTGSSGFICTADKNLSEQKVIKAYFEYDREKLMRVLGKEEWEKIL